MTAFLRHARTALAAVALATMSATTGASGEKPPAPVAASSVAAAATLDRTITDARVVESSGLARSTYPRTILFTHNDKGDTARVFAVRRDGRTTAVLTLAGVTAFDIEDIAAGPGHRLWLADIGDNSRNRATVSVYRFEEPQTLSTRTVSATRFRLRYPDGPHDAEALLVNPKTGRLFVVSKASSGAQVYRAPASLSSTETNPLTAVAPAPATVTAGSWGPGGVHIALGNYRTAFIYLRLGTVQRTIALPATRQGESLEYSRDARKLFRGSEGADSPVFAVPVG